MRGDRRRSHHPGRRPRALRYYTERRYGGEFRDPRRRPATAIAGQQCRPDRDLAPVVPYYALRAYTDGGEHYAGQIGSEPTLGEYVAALIDCTREWVRVLKPCGNLFVNLGDKYATSDHHNNLGANSRLNAGDVRRAKRTDVNALVRQRRYDIQHKSLLGLPWRYALACVDELGLILRAEIVWSKPNGLPESVTDRVRRSHETWFHLTRQPRYYSAVDEIREPASDYARPNGNGREPRGGQRPRLMLDTCNPLGKLPGSVWEIPSEPLRVPPELGVDHFAAFASEWPRRLILGWSPPGICVECGEGRRPVTDVGYVRRQNDRPGSRTDRNPDNNRDDGTAPFGSSALRVATVAGYACACPEPSAPTRPAVIVDPFGGTGTTALVASVLGRVGISVDRSADYCHLARWRTTDPGERARAMRVPKPPIQLDGQLSLLDQLTT